MFGVGGGGGGGLLRGREGRAFLPFLPPGKIGRRESIKKIKIKKTLCTLLLNICTIILKLG